MATMESSLCGGWINVYEFVGHPYSPRANIKIILGIMYQDAEKFLLPINIDPYKNHNDLTLPGR